MERCSHTSVAQFSALFNMHYFPVICLVGMEDGDVPGTSLQVAGW